jgi:hypothetical protein
MTFKRKGSKFFSIVIAFCFLVMTMASGLIFSSAEASPIQTRMDNRDFPSVFQAWNAATAGPGITSDIASNEAKHDLYWGGIGSFGLQWNSSYEGLGTAFTEDSIKNARTYANNLREKNPNMVLLVEIRYFVAWEGYFPDDSPFWMRDENGNKMMAYNMYIEDFNNPDLRAQIATQCAAVANLDFLDGVLIDCFGWDQFGNCDTDPNRIDLIKGIRTAIGNDKLLIVNSNMDTRPNIAPYINGLFMESNRSANSAEWKKISNTLRWANTELREPRVNCIETWPISSRNELNRMRATTTLSLTHGDGYCLFADTWSHAHDWYSFWDAPLGTPTAAGYKRSDNAWQREFTNGTAIYNPMSNGTKTITFAENRKSVATGQIGTSFTLNDEDGDIYLTDLTSDASSAIASSSSTTSANGSASSNANGSNNPGTGDTGILVALVGIISSAGLLMRIKRRKRKA